MNNPNVEASDVDTKEGNGNHQHASDAFTIYASSEPHEAYKLLQVKGPSKSKETKNTEDVSSASSSLLSFKLKLLARFKRAVWKWHGNLIPFLHWQDYVETRFLSRRLTKNGDGSTISPPPPPQELFVNLRVLWNKAISSLDPTSPVYEGSPSLRNTVNQNDKNATFPSNSRLFWTYRLLPPTTRWVLSMIPSFLFPRWFHANIELRTAYLNQAVEKLIDRRVQMWNEENNQDLVNTKLACDDQEQDVSQWNHQNRQRATSNKIRLVILGAGYDTRSIRLLQQGKVDQVWEFDLPPVMESKRWLLKRRGLWNSPIPLHQYDKGVAMLHVNNQGGNDDSSTNSIEVHDNSPKLECIGLDLNQPESFRSALEQLLKASSNDLYQGKGGESLSSSSECIEWYTIVVSEALFLYLEPDIPAKLLTICQDLLGQDSRSRKNAWKGSSSSPSSASPGAEYLAFCFADRFLEVPLAQADDVNAVQQWFDKIGWTLLDWLPKDGATRQMGISRPN